VSVIRFSLCRISTVSLLSLALLAANAFAQAGTSLEVDKSVPSAKKSTVVPRAFPRVDIGAGSQLEYIGSFSADGKFKSLTKFGLFVDSMITASVSDQSVPSSAPPPDASRLIKEDETNQVPPNIELARNERLLEDFEPPEHAVKVAKGQSVLQELRDSIVSLAYGSEKVLLVPQSVTTDSRQRVIVTDPSAQGLHVLAYTPKDSFQIVGGPGRRLRRPDGVAVDKDDNIYVSDSERGMILVYDSEGKFLRNLGSRGEEGMLVHPSGIAIDSKAGKLYVLDPPRNALFILDLEGNVLARIGTADPGKSFSARAGSTEPGRFSGPKAVLVHNDELVVLDSTRVHILDLQGRFLKEFKISNDASLSNGPTAGLFMDDEDRIYVSDPGSGNIRVYSHDGQYLQVFGRPGMRMGEFNAPAGMCADSTGRVYIVDARRVQIFQFNGFKHDPTESRTGGLRSRFPGGMFFGK